MLDSEKALESLKFQEEEVEHSIEEADEAIQGYNEAKANY